MFDMQNIGRTIASARKAHDLTQMELADKLNISFQAISNWERGISMPDISKLPEIANLLDLTIDELLGKSSPVIDDLLSSDDEPLQPAEIEPEDVLEAAPLLKPSQLQNLLEKNKANFDISQFTSFFPFLPQDFLNELAERAYLENGSTGLSSFLPFLSTSKIDALAIQENELGHSIAIFLPFMSSGKLTELAIQKYESNGLSAITIFLPFMKKSLLQKIAENELSEHGLSGLNPLLPFVDKNWLMEIIKKQMNL